MKKVLATLSCAVIIGQIMLTSVVGATGESYDKNQITIPVETPTINTSDEWASDTDKDNNNSNTNPETNTNSETKPTDNTTNWDNENGPSAGDVVNPGHEGGESGNDSGSTSDNDSGSTSDNTCNSEIKLAFMESLTEIINNEISKSWNTGFDSATYTDNTITISIKDKDAKIPNLLNYIRSLYEYILEINNSEFTEYEFWTKLASKNKWFYVNATNGVELMNFYLKNKDEFTTSNKFTAKFNKNSPDECEFPFYVEPSNDYDTSNWNSWKWYSWRGWSSNWWSNTNNTSDDSDNSKNTNKSNEESLTLSWEVADEIMEVKKAESCSIEWSTFSEEENQAYLWACDKWIVIADNIMKADMNKNLTRAELAKMMSIYSEELLWRTRIKNIWVTYPDVDSSLEDLEYYIKEWYRLQIMGIHADGSALSKFSPNSLVTRWEFGTVFSRVLHGSIHNIGNSHYYEKHLKVLKDEWILKNTNHKLVEKRWWILLMLYRSQKVEATNWNINLDEIANISNEKDEIKNETWENISEVETGNNTKLS